MTQPSGDLIRVPEDQGGAGAEPPHRDDTNLDIQPSMADGIWGRYGSSPGLISTEIARSTLARQQSFSIAARLPLMNEVFGRWTPGNNSTRSENHGLPLVQPLNGGATLQPMGLPATTSNQSNPIGNLSTLAAQSSHGQTLQRSVSESASPPGLTSGSTPVGPATASTAPRVPMDSGQPTLGTVPVSAPETTGGYPTENRMLDPSIDAPMHVSTPPTPTAQPSSLANNIINRHASLSPSTPSPGSIYRSADSPEHRTPNEFAPVGRGTGTRGAPPQAGQPAIPALGGPVTPHLLQTSAMPAQGLAGVAANSSDSNIGSETAGSTEFNTNPGFPERKTDNLATTTSADSHGLPTVIRAIQPVSSKTELTLLDANSPPQSVPTSEGGNPTGEIGRTPNIVQSDTQAARRTNDASGTSSKNPEIGKTNAIGPDILRKQIGFPTAVGTPPRQYYSLVTPAGTAVNPPDASVRSNAIMPPQPPPMTFSAGGQAPVASKLAEDPPIDAGISGASGEAARSAGIIPPMTTPTRGESPVQDTLVHRQVSQPQAATTAVDSTTAAADRTLAAPMSNQPPSIWNDAPLPAAVAPASPVQPHSDALSLSPQPNSISSVPVAAPSSLPLTHVQRSTSSLSGQPTASSASNPTPSEVARPGATSISSDLPLIQTAPVNDREITPVPVRPLSVPVTFGTPVLPRYQERRRQAVSAIAPASSSHITAQRNSEQPLVAPALASPSGDMVLQRAVYPATTIGSQTSVSNTTPTIRIMREEAPSNTQPSVGSPPLPADSGGQEMDLEKLADQIYTIIERRLTLERESLGL